MKIAFDYSAFLFQRYGGVSRYFVKLAKYLDKTHQCKVIAPIVDAFFLSSPKNVICADIDVDESIDLYAYLKSKKMVNGIPVILCYVKGNTGFSPNDSVTGADPAQLDAFFKRCGNHLKKIEDAYKI